MLQLEERTFYRYMEGFMHKIKPTLKNRTMNQ